MKNSILIIIFSVVIFLGSFFLIGNFSKDQKSNEYKFVKIAGQKVKVDLAVSETEKEKGLSGKSSLGENEGMLFVFNTEDKYPFWMKDMNFPLDMIWLNKDLKVVYVKKEVLPESYPKTFIPSENAKYVLEVPAGFSEKNNLQVGDSALFIY